MSTDLISQFIEVVPKILLFAGGLFVVTFALNVFRVVLRGIIRFKQSKATLEITPPAQTNKSHEATTALCSALHGLGVSGSLFERIVGVKPVFCLEIHATRPQGIRFFITAPHSVVDTVETHLATYLPDAKVRKTDDNENVNIGDKHGRILEFKQTHHYGFPLKAYEMLEDTDPIAYITGAMTKLEDDEKMIMQVVFEPTHVTEAERLAERILRNGHVISEMRGRGGSSKILGFLSSLSIGLIELVSDIASHSGTQSSSSTSYDMQKYNRNMQVQSQIQPERTLSRFEQELVESVHNKLNNPLFKANIRAYIESSNRKTIKERQQAVRSAFGLYRVPKYQELRQQRRKFLLGKRLLKSLFDRRALMPLSKPMYLSSTEITSLYHFPNSHSGQAENVVKSLSRTLPAPLVMKNGTELDVLLGENSHHGSSTSIGLTAEERERHTFIVGGTGNGKTTLMKYAIIQDILSGKGVAVLDPHGDLAKELLEYIPEERLKDVIYFNPYDMSYPISVNLLEIPEGFEGDALNDAKDSITESVVTIMRKTFSDDATGGHRVEYNLRNAVLTALTVQDATIFTVYDIITNSRFRKPIVRNLKEEWLKNFWNNEFSKAGSYQQVKMMAGVTAKIGRYHASVSASRILSQPKSTIDFDEILDGKILICNLAKGYIGEDTSEIMGISILAKLQLAAYRRIKRDQVDRKPFYVYVDEFQNFATTSFVEMLSEARKYKLYLTMAEQTLSQQDDQKIVNTIITNTGTLVCFRTNSTHDEHEMTRYFHPYINQGEIMNLPTFNFFMRISATDPREPLSGKTVIPRSPEELRKLGLNLLSKDVVIEASRANYAIKHSEIKPESQSKPPASSRSAPTRNRPTAPRRNRKRAVKKKGQ